MMRWLKSVWRLVLIGCVLLLAGCLQYDLDIQFDSQTHGQFVQQFHWRGADIATSPQWSQTLESLRDRATALGGTAQFTDSQTVTIAIPFNNGRELEAKFNQFFAPDEANLPLTLLGEAPMTAHLLLHQGNWLGVIFNHIDLRFDLTSVPTFTETGVPLLQGRQLLTGQVSVTAPWIRSASGDLTSATTWTLLPGEMNEFAADFWVPSPIGIGAGAIALGVLIGYALKYWLKAG